MNISEAFSTILSFSGDTAPIDLERFDLDARIQTAVNFIRIRLQEHDVPAEKLHALSNTFHYLMESIPEQKIFVRNVYVNFLDEECIENSSEVSTQALSLPETLRENFVQCYLHIHSYIDREKKLKESHAYHKNALTEARELLKRDGIELNRAQLSKFVREYSRAILMEHAHLSRHAVHFWLIRQSSLSDTGNWSFYAIDTLKSDGTFFNYLVAFNNSTRLLHKANLGGGIIDEADWSPVEHEETPLILQIHSKGCPMSNLSDYLQRNFNLAPIGKVSPPDNDRISDYVNSVKNDYCTFDRLDESA